MSCHAKASDCASVLNKTLKLFLENVVCVPINSDEYGLRPSSRRVKVCR